MGLKQTVAIVTALMLALLGVSGFIVAGSVEQMQTLTQKNSLLEELYTKLEEERGRVQVMDEERSALSDALDQTVRERDALMSERDSLLGECETLMRERESVLHEAAQTDGAAKLLAAENEAITQRMESLADERDALAKALETAQAQLLGAQEDAAGLRAALAQAQQEAKQAMAREQEAQLAAAMDAQRRAEGQPTPTPHVPQQTAEPSPQRTPGNGSFLPWQTPRPYVTVPVPDPR